MDWYKVTTKRSDYWRSWGIKSFAELYTKSIKCQLWMITHNISLPQFNRKRRILLYILPTLIQFITSIQWLKSAPFFFVNIGYWDIQPDTWGELLTGVCVGGENQLTLEQCASVGPHPYRWWKRKERGILLLVWCIFKRFSIEEFRKEMQHTCRFAIEEFIRELIRWSAWSVMSKMCQNLSEHWFKNRLIHFLGWNRNRFKKQKAVSQENLA